MTTTNRESMRVIVYREGDAWIAQCLEYDIVAQGCDFQSAMRRIVATVNAESNYTTKKHDEEFKGIDPAPAIFEDMFKSAEQSLQADNIELRIAA